MKIMNRKREAAVQIPVNLLSTVFGIESADYTNVEFDSDSNSILLYKKK